MEVVGTASPSSFNPTLKAKKNRIVLAKPNLGQKFPTQDMKVHVVEPTQIMMKNAKIDQ